MASSKVERHVISLILENESGALSRVAGLFSARGYNIESLTVAPVDDVSVSRMTIVTTGSEEIVTQITKQLNKLVDVIKLVDFEEESHIERELLLVKLNATASDSKVVKGLVEKHNGRYLISSESCQVLEFTGSGDELNAFMSSIDPSLVLECVRSGALGIGDRRSLDY